MSCTAFDALGDHKRGLSLTYMQAISTRLAARLRYAHPSPASGETSLGVWRSLASTLQLGVDDDVDVLPVLGSWFHVSTCRCALDGPATWNRGSPSAVVSTCARVSFRPTACNCDQNIKLRAMVMRVSFSRALQFRVLLRAILIHIDIKGGNLSWQLVTASICAAARG